jgi:hypothetical protein
MKRAGLFCLLILVLAIGCRRSPEPKELFNDGAAIPSGASIHPLAWRVINSSIDPMRQTMSTLFGNDIAIESARTPSHTDYPAGAILARVTWSEKEDEHWFGARIPKRFESMEIVRVEQGAEGKPVSSYERLVGPSLQATADTPAEVDANKNSILRQRASVMP